MADRCVYVSATRGVHDERWLKALADLDFTPVSLIRNQDESDASFRERVAIASQGAPILAGPLDSVTTALIGLPRLVGLSWGFDLHRMPLEQRTTLASTAGLIVDSEATRDLAIEAGVGAITLLPWGVDLEEFSPRGERYDIATLNVPEAVPLILSLRALEPPYRVGDIVEAMPALLRAQPDAHLIIGNSGSLQESLAQRAAALDVDTSLTFIGTLPEQDLPSLLRRCAVYVSMSEVDGTSVTLLQAMACGTRVVVSDIPGNKPWVRDGVTGRLTPLGDSDALATAICDAIRDGAHWVSGARSLVERSADWYANQPRLRAALNGA